MKKIGELSSNSRSGHKSGGQTPNTINGHDNNDMASLTSSNYQSENLSKSNNHYNPYVRSGYGSNNSNINNISNSNNNSNNNAKNLLHNQNGLHATSQTIAKLEEDIMNASTNRGGKSDLLERNLNQMVGVLHSRLKDLRSAASLRIQLSNDDPKGDTKTESIQAPRIGKDLDEILPKYKDLKLGHRDNNLVATEGVHIDTVKLVIKTKQTTEASKRLEVRLDDTFGNMASIRELLGKKTKGTMSSRDEATRINEQNKSEVKRQLRLDLERELFSLMENHVSRSILETALVFKAPIDNYQEVEWPIPIKWPKRDPRYVSNMNNDGEMNTDLLLHYAIEKMSLPSGENLFRRLIKLVIIQDYFVYLFWLVKLKLFHHMNESEEDEIWLLKRTATLYSQLITSVGQRAKEEHEKDFLFKYLPFIYSNAIYYSFYFLCPGSRHLYSKGLRKTIYMQIIMIMFGMQLCPAAVKVAWTKLFPEDMSEEENNIGTTVTTIEELMSGNGHNNLNNTGLSNSNGIGIGMNNLGNRRGESLPVAIAFTGVKRTLEKVEKYIAKTKSQSQNFNNNTANLSNFDMNNRVYSPSSESIGYLNSNMNNSIGKRSPFRGVLSISNGSDEDISIELSTTNLNQKNHNSSSNNPIVSSAIAAAERALIDPNHAVSLHTKENIIHGNNDGFTNASMKGKAFSSSIPMDEINTANYNSDNSNNQSKTISYSNVITPHNTTNPSPMFSRPSSHRIRHADSLSHLIDNTNKDSNNNSKDFHDSEKDKEKQTNYHGMKSSNPVKSISSSEILKKLAEDDPLFRTNLLPLAQRPRHYPPTISHQMKDSLNTKTISPLVQTFLNESKSESRLTLGQLRNHRTTDNPNDVNDANDTNDANTMDSIDAVLLKQKQPFGNTRPHIHSIRRTVPVSWCRVGGVDTHHRLSSSLSKDHIEELSNKSQKASKKFHKETIMSLIQRARAIENVNDKYQKVLASGSQKISRFALDILKQQQKLKSSSSNSNTVIFTGKSLSPTKRNNRSALGLGLSNTSNTNSPSAVVNIMRELLSEPQLDENLTDIIATAQLDKEDLLQEFLNVL